MSRSPRNRRDGSGASSSRGEGRGSAGDGRGRGGSGGSSRGRSGSDGRPGRSGSGRPERRGGKGGPARTDRSRGRKDDDEQRRPRRRTVPSGGRIPPPPVIRDEVTIERVHDGGEDAPKPRKKRSRRSVDVSDVEMGGVAPATAAKAHRRLSEAAQAFEAERFRDAERLLTSLTTLTPGVPEVHELLGLTHYRQGKWTAALRELERFREATGSVEQNPVMADCNRALSRWDAAEQLWFELGDASPTPELVEEGRIVQAGILADRGKLADAIRFLEKAPKPRGKPAIYHLRRWYVIADLYERAGDNSRARRLFADITHVEPAFGDAAERAANLA